MKLADPTPETEDILKDIQGIPTETELLTGNITSVPDPVSRGHYTEYKNPTRKNKEESKKSRKQSAQSRKLNRRK